MSVIPFLCVMISDVTALTPGDSDTQVVGKCMGKFLSKLLMVEVPDTTATPSYQKVGSLM